MSERESGVPGTTRRGMLRGAAGIGAAGLAAGVFAGAVAGPASAATATPAKKDAVTTKGAGSAAHTEPLTVHVHDASTGVVDLYSGTQHVRITDHQLAARLAQAAR